MTHEKTLADFFHECEAFDPREMPSIRHALSEIVRERDAANKRVAELEGALRKARPFIRRQLTHGKPGKHEQDTLDAVEWFDEYGSTIEAYPNLRVT